MKRLTEILSAIWHGVVRTVVAANARANKVFDALGAVQPLYFLMLYVLCVPLFAQMYLALSTGSFNAPHAKFERDAKEDAGTIVKALETVVRQHLESLEDRRLALQTKDSDTEWRVIPERLYFSRWDISETGIKLVFGIAMSQGTEEKLFANLPVTIRSSRTTLQGGSNDVLIYVDYDQEAITAEPLRAYLQKYHVFAGMPIAHLPFRERVLIANYLDGYGGDPTSFSGSFWRMLYFSVVVITTVGFGDIVPMTGAARALVAVEAMIGVLLVGLFLNSIASRRERNS
jgi:hypothetical protein